MTVNTKAYSIARPDLGICLLRASFFAVVTATLARVSFHLPGEIVPITLQVLGVILSGLVLGSRWGAISQIQYLMMGAMGAPVFAGMGVGPAAFAGPTGGYLFGFIVGAYAAGWMFERLRDRTSLATWIAGIAGMVGIYALGAPWLAIWLKCTMGLPARDAIMGAWQHGVVLFIGIDFLKVILASSLTASGRSGLGLFRAMTGR